MGFLGGLTLVFVLAKLAGWVAWSWWLVFSPVLVWLGFAAIFFLVALALGMTKP